MVPIFFTLGGAGGVAGVRHCHLIESCFLNGDGIISYSSSHCDTCMGKYIFLTL